jgi:hypothetical protein
MDCRYCHDGVEKSYHSNVPSSSTCMNCHNQVLKEDPKLALVRDSAATGKPIPWMWIHKTPDYAYFNHSVHVNRGISCYECHGQVNKMDEVSQAQPLSMTFCLDCHRNPAAFIRPPGQVFNLDWRPASETEQLAFGKQKVTEWKVQTQSLDNCSVCHR